MTQEVKFHDAGLNRWTQEQRFEVVRSRIAAYAAATNDPIAAHRAGDVAPPLFAVVPAFELMMKPAVDAIPAVSMTRVLHGAQDIRFHRTIRPGDILVSRGRLIGYEGVHKGRRAQKATLVAVFVECRTDDGALVNQQYATALVLGVNAGPLIGKLAPSHEFDRALHDVSPAAAVSHHVDADQTLRYAAASGDPVPIHLDDEVAREAGLPGIIAHGLCTMAFASSAVVNAECGAQVNRLRRLAAKFSKIVLPGDDLETRMWPSRGADGLVTCAFEMTRGTEAVLTDGIAEIGG